MTASSPRSSHSEGTGRIYVSSAHVSGPTFWKTSRGTAALMQYMYGNDPEFPADYARTLRMKDPYVTDLDIEEAVGALVDWSPDKDHAEFLYGAMRDLERLANKQYEDSKTRHPISRRRYDCTA